MILDDAFPKRTTSARRFYWYLVLALLIVFVASLLLPKRAVSNRTEVIELTLPELPASLPPLPAVGADPDLDPVQTKAAVLMDGATGTVLYSEEPNTVLPIASTTKLMTALVVRERLPLDSVVEITTDHVSVIGSDMGLRSGEKLTVRSLLTGLLVTSGNDAAWALADAASGSREAFVVAMNVKAAAIGLKQTQFADPAGLETTSQSTAFELALLAQVALTDPVIAEIVRLPEVTITSTNGLVRHDLKNSNRLVNEFAYLGAVGLKTGFTPDAGHCLVAAAERDGHRLIAVILHTDADTITASAIEAQKLLDWGWANVDWK